MNGFRGCRKGSQGDLLASTGEISFLPSILQRTRVFSQRTAPPPPAEKRDTQTIPVLGSGYTTSMQRLGFKSLLSHLTVCMSENMLQNLSKPQLSPTVNWGIIPTWGICSKDKNAIMQEKSWLLEWLNKAEQGSCHLCCCPSSSTASTAACWLRAEDAPVHSAARQGRARALTR